jgi:hypothetical protein
VTGCIKDKHKKQLSKILKKKKKGSMMKQKINKKAMEEKFKSIWDRNNHR